MQEDDELQDLVRTAQTGDAAAMDELLTRLQPTVLRRCSRFLPHLMDAEEAAQDALMLISRKIGAYSGRGSFLGWVTVVSSNAARATYGALRSRAEISGAVAAPDTVDARTTSVIAGTRLDLMESVEELARQHPALVESFVLRDLCGLTYAEIAQTTEVPLGTVKDRIHQARKFMQARLSLQPDMRR